MDSADNPTFYKAFCIVTYKVKSILTFDFFMQKIFYSLLAICFLLAACNIGGNKININDKSEVYYKGDGVTKADAQKLGNFLQQQNFFNTVNERSVQLTKDSGAYVVRIVVDEKAVKDNKEELETSFKVWQMWIAENVFPGAPVKLKLTNGKFEDLMDVGQFSEEEKKALFNNADQPSPTGKPGDTTTITDEGVSTDTIKKN
jgi:hypothetical protein